MNKSIQYSPLSASPKPQLSEPVIQNTDERADNDSELTKNDEDIQQVNGVQVNVEVQKSSNRES